MPIISDFDGPEETAFLSNFSPAVVTAGFSCFPGHFVTTTEHAYQAAKTLNETEAWNILTAETPGKAKWLGRKCTIRPDWDDVKVDVMLDALRQKFSIPDLREKLLATGEAFLVEGNTWHDTFWGCCVCPTHDGDGRNWLGHLLMQVRDEVRKS